MFTRIRIKNFKAWGDQLWRHGVELAPITLFLGTNSAGKTSLLQPLLLLQQTFTSPDRSLDLYLGGKRGDILDLGTYEQIVHRHQLGMELGFGLSLKDVSRVHAGNYDSEDDFSWYFHQIPTTEELKYEATYGHATGSLHLKHLKFEHGDLTVAATRSAKGAYRLTAPGYNPRTKKDGSSIPKREFKPEKSLSLSDAGRQAIRAGRLGMDDLSLALSAAIERVQYLGPLRERPQPTYLWGGQEPGTIGTRGEHAVAALLANLNAAKKSERGQMVREVSRWLKLMGVADSLDIEQLGTSRLFEVMLTTAGQKANLVHVGFGVSQVLPMIVLALTAPEESTIIAEQPEIHLHPAAQTTLANLLVETSKRRNLQFLIETHSEHLFRRLQYLIAAEELAASDCRLYFVDRDESHRPRLESLEIDPFGRVKNWPKHFFGDAMGETERQMRAMIDRLKGAR